MRYLKLTLAYDGSNYQGFQRQKNAVGVQQVLEQALSKLLCEKINLAASGRTDTGVHARGQVVSFATVSTVPTDRIVPALASFLPADIVVRQVEVVDSGFNARFSALRKRYQYRILIAEHANPFERHYAWQMHKPLQLAAMQEATQLLVGTHDFAAFRSQGSAAVNTIKTMFVAQWQELHPHELIFTIEGNGFLYHMVRSIVGTLVRVGMGKLTVARFQEILVSKQRALAGMAAPPQGLYLDEVIYPQLKK